jgi:hypothetical protein
MYMTSSQDQIPSIIAAYSMRAFIATVRRNSSKKKERRDEIRRRRMPRQLGALRLQQSKYTLAGVDASRKTKEKLSYRSCFTCPPHPNYPSIHPVTLHIGNKCLICNESNGMFLTFPPVRRAYEQKREEKMRR